MGYYNNALTLKENIIQEIMEDIESYTDTYGADLVNEMYNNDYYIIGTYQAKEFVKEFFDEMTEALKRHEEVTGEQYPYITDVERLATLTVYFVAEDIINETLEKMEDLMGEPYWNDTIEDDDIELFKYALSLAHAIYMDEYNPVEVEDFTMEHIIEIAETIDEKTGKVLEKVNSGSYTSYGSEAAIVEHYDLTDDDELPDSIVHLSNGMYIELKE